MKVLYGVEGNSTFLECIGRSPQAELRWTFQNTEKQHQGGRGSGELVSAFKEQTHLFLFTNLRKSGYFSLNNQTCPINLQYSQDSLISVLKNT